MAVSLENPLAYCREKVSSETSSLHYATLFQSDELKAFWLGMFTLNHELRQACLKQLESGLTQVKLGWWQNALANAGENKNPHPVISALSNKVVVSIPAAHWGQLINSVASGCEPKRYNNMTGWQEDVANETAPWELLIQTRMGDFHNNQGKLLAFWTESIRLCQLLRLAKYLDQGFQPIPIETLQAHGVTAEQIKRREHSAQSSALFATTGEILIKQANRTWAEMPPEQKLFARPLRALFRMRVAEFQVHKANDFKLLTEQKIITPFKKFTTAWTTQVLRW